MNVLCRVLQKSSLTNNIQSIHVNKYIFFLSTEFCCRATFSGVSEDKGLGWNAVYRSMDLEFELAIVLYIIE